MNTFQPREEICSHCGIAKDKHVGWQQVCPRDVKPVHVEATVALANSYMGYGDGNAVLTGDGIYMQLHQIPADTLLLSGKDYRVILTEVPL
jgi:hypothetical protein